MGRLIFTFTALLAVGVSHAERLYFLTEKGLSSVLTSGDEREDYNEWSGASAHCSHDARGLGIDEIEGWASVTCGNEFFKANFAEDPNAPFELIDFGPQVKDSQGFYGTAINTDTHTAYVASYESSSTFNGWKVRGNYLRGCTTVTSETYCVEKGPCYWINDKCLVKDKYTYKSLKTAAGPVGGGLYADEDNVVWLSYNLPTGTGTEGGGYVGAKKDSKEVYYPHVHDTFPEGNYGNQDIGYPQMINDALYVCSQTEDSTDLYKFDATHDPELVIPDLPKFRGTYIGADRPIRQPSFAVIDADRILQVNSAGIDEYSLSTHLFQTVISERNIGPLFYRLLPKKKTLVPGDTPSPTEAPPTPAPPTTAAPTRKPGTIFFDTAVPTDAPPTNLPAGKTLAPPVFPGIPLPPGETLAPGATLVPGTAQPGAAAGGVTTDPVQGTEEEEKKDDGVGIEVVLIIVGAALLCMSLGLLAGFVLCKKKPPPQTPAPLVEAVAPAPVLYEAKEAGLPESPTSVPPSPHWLPLSDRNFSDCPSLIQTCELSVIAQMRSPAGDVRHQSESFAEITSAGAGRGSLQSSSMQSGSYAPPRRRSATHAQHFGELSPTTSHHSVPLVPRANSPPSLFTPKERFNSVHDKAKHHTHHNRHTISTATLSV